jgi:hypothetical protein
VENLRIFSCAAVAGVAAPEISLAAIKNSLGV